MEIITSVQFKPKVEGLAQVWNLNRRHLSRKQDLNRKYQFNVADKFFLSFSPPLHKMEKQYMSRG